MAVKRTDVKGLLPEAFKKYPTIAKAILAYNAIHLLFPRQLTRKLPGKFGKIYNKELPNPIDVINEYGGPAIPAGYDWTKLSPDVLQLIAHMLYLINITEEFPMQEIVPFVEEITTPAPPPLPVFPAGWSMGDPLPEGVYVLGDAAFPADWKAGDPLPAGFRYEPGAGYDPDYNYFAEAVLGGKEMLCPVTGAIAPYGLSLAPTERPRPPGFSQAPGGGLLDIYSDEEDGYIYSRAYNSWADAQNQAGFSGTDKTSAYLEEAIKCNFDSEQYYIFRAFLPFSIPAGIAGKTIKSAYLSIYGPAGTLAPFCVQQGTFALPLVTSGFTGFTGAPFSVVNRTGNWTYFELNAAGRAYVQSVAGTYAKLVIRDYTNDYPNIAPLAFAGNFASCYFKEEANTALRPLLTITY